MRRALARYARRLTTRSARPALAVLLLAVTLTVVPAGPATAVEEPAFGTPLVTMNLTGDIVYVGNTSMTCPASAACTDAQSDPGGTPYANNNFNMIQVDVDADASTFNSSSADFTIPAGGTVHWAGLFWGAVSTNASRTSVQFRVPGGAYQTITAPTANLYTSGSNYQAFTDVTSLVQAAGSGTYTTANVQNTLGSGRHAGWSLVIIVEDPAQPFRNLSVFDGFQQINPSNPVDVTVSGFLSPPTGPVLAEVGFLTYEGDEFYTGDFAQLNGTQLGDAVNSSTNFFNSRITDGGAYVTTKNPDYYDQLGFDAKVINTVGIVPAGATSATVQLRSAGDWYYNGLVTTAIDIYVPNLVLDLEKTATDLNGGDVHPGDVIRYNVTFSNQGDDGALDTVLTDAIPAGTTYVPGSAQIVTGDNPGTTNAIYDGGSDSLTFYMGTGASPGTGGRIGPESITGTVYDLSFDVTVDTAAAGTTVQNIATLSYTAETIGDAFTADTPAAASPVIALSNLVFDAKDDTVDPVLAGEATTYDLTVSNSGPNDAEDVEIVDTLPVGFSLDSAASTSGCVASGSPASGQTVTCDVGTLAAGATTTVSVVADVLGDAAATTVTNSATVSTSTAESNSLDNAASELTTVDRLVDLGVTKSFAPDPVLAGEQITYTLTASNAGPSDAQNVSLTDSLPAGVSFASVDDTACAESAGTVTCSWSELAAGSSNVVEIVVDVPASALDTATLTNNASISSDDPEAPTGAPNSTSTNTPVDRSADLALVKTGSGPYVAGTTALFDLDVTNNGPSDASSIVVTDTLPSGTTFNAALSSSDCSASGPTVTCDLVQLDAGDSGSFTVALDLAPTIAAGTSLTNTASVAAAEPDPTAANDSDALGFTVSRSADLSILKEASVDTVAAGSNIVYTLTAENHGPSDASNVTITDTLPAGVSLVGAPGCSGTTTLSCAVGDLAAGASAVFTVTVAVPGGAPDGSNLVNTASVTGSEPDPVAGNDSSQVTTTVDRTVLLEITKIETTGFADPALAGTSVSWDVVVSNMSTSTDTNVAITDDLSGLPVSGVNAVITGGGNSCSVTTGVVDCAIPSFVGSGSETITITATLDDDIADGTVLTNVADADGDFSNPVSGTEETTVLRRADLVVDKTGPATLTAGTTATWTVTLDNNGPGQADNVLLSDVLPATAVYVTNRVTSGSAACVLNGGTVECTVGSMGAGDQVVVEIDADILDTETDGASLTNAAFVTSDTTDDTPADNNDNVIATVQRRADLDLTKTTLDDPVAAGDTVRFQLTVDNLGPSLATGVTVTDPVPAGFTFDPGLSDAGCSLVSTDVVCALGAIDPDDPAVTAVVAFTVGAAQPIGTVTNNASVTATEADTVPANNTASSTVDVVARADLSVVKTGPLNIVAGTDITWNIDVASSGPSDAVNTVVTDTLPAGVTFDSVASDSRCSVISGTPATGQVLECILGTLSDGAATSIVVAVSVDPAVTGSLANSATINSDASDPNIADNTSTATSPVVSRADLSLTKTGPATAVAGQPATWTHSVANGGESDAHSTVLTDTLPIGASFDAIASDGRCEVTAGTPATGQVISCLLNTFAAGGSDTITIVADLDPMYSEGLRITNDASISTSSVDPDLSNNDDSFESTIDRVADLALVKTATPSTINAGTVATFNLTLTNNGPSAAAIATIDDPLPAGLSLDSFTLLTAGSCSGSISCSASELAPGDTLSVDVVVAADSALADGATITNNATASAAEDPDGATATAGLSISRLVDLEITKVADIGAVTAGQPITYTVTVGNFGPSDASGVTITDPVPTDFTFDPATSDPACALVSTDVVCTIASLSPADGAVDVVIGFDVNGDAAIGTVTNTASVASTEADVDPSNNASSADVSVGANADLSISKSSPAAAPVPGENYSWTVSVTNDGPSTADLVVVTDDLPPGVTFDAVSSAPSCSVTAGTPATGQTISCSLGTVAPGTVPPLSIVGLVDASATGDLTNGASVTSSTGDADPSNNTADDTRTLVAEADLDLDKTGPPIITAGTDASWTVQVDNNGPSDVPSASVTDQLPAGVTFDGVASDPRCSVTGGTPATGQTLTCTIGAMTSGASTSLTVIGAVDPALPAASTLTNTASASSPVTDPMPADNSDSSSSTVIAEADLALAKTVDDPTPTAGQTITYTVALTNNGPSTASNVTLTDPLFASLSGVTADAGGAATCSVASGVTCTAADLAPGASITVTIEGTLDNDIADGTTIVNTASASADETDPDGADSSASIDVTLAADLTIAKSVASPSVVAGQAVTYTVSIDNAGPSLATGVSVVDAIPAHLTFDAAGSDGRCAVVATDVVCAIGDMDPTDPPIDLTLVFDVSGSAPDGLITNTAALAGNETDPDPVSNTASVDVAVGSNADVSIIKTSPAAAPEAGGIYAWDLAVANAGPSTAAAVVVTDVLPIGLTFDSVASSAPCAVTAGTPATGQTVTCTLGNLSSGASADLDIVVDIDPAVTGDLDNTATVSSDTLDADSTNNASTDSRTLVVEADLGVSKSGPASVTAGTDVSWSVHVSNAGPAQATSTTVIDTLPAGLTFDAVASDGRCSVTSGTPATGQVLTCVVGDLAPGGTTILAVVAATDPALTMGTTIVNNASVSSDATDPSSVNDTAAHGVAVLTSADLALVKTVDNATPTAGEDVTYTLALINNGPSTATSVAVTDGLAAGLTAVSATSPGATCSTSPSVSCTTADLDPGETLVVTVVATVDADVADGATITNIASATADEDDPDGATSSTPLTASREADLTITKVADAAGVVAGQTVTYTVSVANAGPSVAGGVTVVDAVPGGFVFDDAASDSRCSLVTTDVVCSIGDVDPADPPVDLELVFDVPPTTPDGDVTNTAIVAGDEADPDTGSNTGSVVVNVGTSADLSLTKTSPAAAPSAGGNYAWTLDIENAGPSTAENTVVLDALPAGATFDAGASTGTCSVTGGTPATGQTVTCLEGDLAPGATRTITIATTLDASLAGSITNAASISSDTSDADGTNNLDDDTRTVSSEADLSVGKSGPANADAGTDINWTVLVDNAGPSSVTDAVVTDDLPAGVTFDAVASDPRCSVISGTPATGQRVECTVGAMGVSGTESLTIVAAVDAATADGTVLTNQVSVTSSATDPDPTDDTATHAATVDASADLSVVKVADSSAVLAGETIGYTITVANAGPSIASNVVVVDPFTDPSLTPLTADGGGAATCTVTSGVSCSVATLLPGASVVITVDADVDPTAPDGVAIANSVTASADEDDPDGATGAASVTVSREADLSITKSLPAGGATAGGVAEFVLEVTNAGPSVATSVVVADDLPPELTYDDAASDARCAPNGADVVCTIASLVPGVTESLTIATTVDGGVAEGTSLDNTAVVAATETDPDSSDDSATLSFPITQLVDLSIDKQSPATAPVPGASTAWTIDIANAGPSDASSVLVGDVLPAGATFDSGGSDARCAVTGGTPATGQTVSCAIPLLPNAAADSLVISASLDPDLTGDLVNVASIASAEADADPSSNSDTTTDTLEPLAAVALTKSVLTSPVVAGAPVVYELQVANTGVSTAADVVVTDVVPAELTFDDVLSDPRCTESAGTVTCGVGDVGPSASTTLQLHFDVSGAAIDFSTITNSASMTTSTPDDDPSDDTDSVSSVIRRSADLVVGKIGPATAFAGETITYTLSLQNNGPSVATGVSLDDTLPAGMEVRSVSGLASCTSTATTVSCPITTLDAGSSEVVTVEVDVLSSAPDGALLTNSLVVTAAELDPTPGDTTASVSTAVSREADLAVVKTIQTTPIVPGALSVFEVTVTNNGPSDASTVVVTDTLAAGFVFRPDLSSTQCGSGVTCSLPTLPAGDTATFTITAETPNGLVDGDPFSNTASVAATESDPDASDNSSTDSTEVGRAADLTLVKDGPAGPVNAGDSVTWTLDVSNAGPSTATNVLLLDGLPSGAVFDAASSDPRCNLVGGDVECSLPALAAGAATSFALVADLSPSIPDGTTLINGATVFSDELDTNTVDNSSVHSVDVARTVGLVVTKTDLADPVVAGQNLGWDIDISNSGPSIAGDVIIEDDLPVGATFLAAPSDPNCGVTAGTPMTGQTVTCSLGDLSVGGALSVRIVAALDVGLVDGVQITNVATVTVNGSTVETATEETTVLRVADVEVTKAADTSPIVPGQPVTYTVTISNAGPSVASNVVLTDMLPTGGTVVDVDGPTPCSESSGTLTCVTGTVLPGADAVYLIEILPAAFLPSGDPFVNQVLVTSDEDPDDETATSGDVTARRVELSVDKTAGSATVASGGYVTFELTVTNEGPSNAENVVVTDTLPSDLTYDPATSTCPEVLGVVTCTIATMTPGQSASFTIGAFADLAATGSVTNTASVTSDEPNTNPDPDGEVSVLIREETDLELVKTGPASVDAGELITYRFEVSSSGPSDAPNARIVDELPAGLTPVLLPPDCSVAGSTLTCELGTLTAGDTALVDATFRVPATAVGTIRNAAVLSSDATDVDPVSNVSSVDTSVIRTADLHVEKRLVSPDPRSGEVATWEIDITNNGPASATGIAVSDQLPDGVAFVASASSSGCTSNGAVANETLTCAVGDLAVDATTTVTVAAAVHESYLGPIDNTATVTHNENDPTPNAVTAVGTAQGRDAELVIEKTIVDVEHRHRGDVRYAITVTNNGPDDVITPILILDELESNQGYWSFTVSDQAACVPTNTSISCIADGLAVGDTITLNLRTKITSTSDTDYVSNSVRVLAAGVRGGISDEGVFEAVASVAAAVEEQEPAPSPAPAPTGPLAFTGGTPARLVAVALLLVALGGVAVMGSRRRRGVVVAGE